MPDRSDGAPADTPPPLLPGYVSNFRTMLRAAENGDLLLMSAIRKSDRAPVALVCAASRPGDGLIEVVPFCVMCEGDPFEDFEDPTVISEDGSAG